MTVWMGFAQEFLEVLYASYVVKPFKFLECADGLQFTCHTEL